MANPLLKKPVYIGILFPFQKGPNGIPAQVTDIDLIKSDFYLLLVTRKGERVMDPNFGTDLEALIFENNGALLRAKAFREIADAVSNYEPRISILDVQISSQTTNGVVIDITYQIQGFVDMLSVSMNRG